MAKGIWNYETWVRKFWERVVKRGPDECWLWTGRRANTRQRYGRVQWKGVLIPAHRVAYELTYGPTDAPLIRHTCDTEDCVNPRHLIPGTVAQNNADCIERGRAKPPTGEGHGNSKLTDNAVRDIRCRATRVVGGAHRLEPGKVAHAVLAKEYGVSKATISMALNGVQWKHIS